ncbi:MAG: hypothetical protein ACTSPM_09295, partial [Candidatus Heimdallarchaeota archaeon]
MANLPTLFSITDDFRKELDKRDKFLKGIKTLKNQLAKRKTEPYIMISIEQIHSLLEKSKTEKGTADKIRIEIDNLLNNNKFKKGSSVIELSKDTVLDKTLKVKNLSDLKFFQDSKSELRNLKRYTIDSIKTYQKIIDKDRRRTEEITKVRVIEAVLNIDKFKGELDQLTLGDFLDTKNWLEEDREEKDQIVEYHKTLDELNDLFPTKGKVIAEGRIFLANKRFSKDITELARQTTK